MLNYFLILILKKYLDEENSYAEYYLEDTKNIQKKLKLIILNPEGVVCQTNF